MEIDVYEIYELQQSSTTLILVTNGGADDSQGSTGWIISDNAQRCLHKVVELFPVSTLGPIPPRDMLWLVADSPSSSTSACSVATSICYPCKNFTATI
jgi:hypothetical protein